MRTLLVIALAAAAASAQQSILKVGDDAPPLAVAKWVKGEPVTLEKGKLYVIEFWATWCGPCVASMPHLSELQDTYRDKITFIGVTKEDAHNSLEAVETMVREKGPGMGYTVAWDDQATTYGAYMTAAGQNGIPCSFVVDGNGKIAYIGHPVTLDLVLAWLVQGKWDPATSPAAMGAVFQRGQEIFQMDRTIALASLPAFEKEHPEVAHVFAQQKLEMLLLEGKNEEADALGAELVEKAAKYRSEQNLNSLAWFLVDPKTDIAERHLDLALKAAEQAVEVSKGEDGAILDTLARVYFWKGDLTKAIEIQEKAVQKAANQPEMLADLRATLEEYKEKAGAEPAKPAE